jgi:hypothetical protein
MVIIINLRIYINLIIPLNKNKKFINHKVSSNFQNLGKRFYSTQRSISYSSTSTSLNFNDNKLIISDKLIFTGNNGKQ